MILLLSADFLASPSCIEIAQEAMRSAGRGGAGAAAAPRLGGLLPGLLSSPNDGRAVVKYEQHYQAWLSVVEVVSMHAAGAPAAGAPNGAAPPPPKIQRFLDLYLALLRQELRKGKTCASGVVMAS